MKIIENTTSFETNEIFTLAKRENNAKRSFLIVNPTQAKHIPVSPDRALLLFRQLGEKMKNICANQTILVISFAETATAIGAEVARVLGNNSYFLHTTREDLDDEYKLVNFCEEHSHAIEQKLYCKKWSEIIRKVDKIIFVEDEISTGKTVLNVINAIQSMINPNIHISVASLINVMSVEQISIFTNMNIDIYYLLRADKESFDKKIYKHDISNNHNHKNVECEANILLLEVRGLVNPRYGTTIDNYLNNCEIFSDHIIKALGHVSYKNILILGTEEFMFPAIHLGNEILTKCSPSSVKVHATTRSPIIACSTDGYPIKSRCEIKSMYSSERQTYIYNLYKYELVIFVTDSNNETLGFNELCNSLISIGNENIVLAKWVCEN